MLFLWKYYANYYGIVEGEYTQRILPRTNTNLENEEFHTKDTKRQRAQRKRGSGVFVRYLKEEERGKKNE